MSQVWLITGVSSGLGQNIALKALDSGSTVIGTVRSRQRAAKQVEEIESIGGKCLELDITDAQACADMYIKAQQLHGRIDVLVNNAGVSYLGPVEDFTDEEAKAQMEVSYHGPLRLIQAALPGFRIRQSGTIVNITSIAGINGLPGVGMYAASKFALEGMPRVQPTSLKSPLTTIRRSLGKPCGRSRRAWHPSLASRARPIPYQLPLRFQDTLFEIEHGALRENEEGFRTFPRDRWKAAR